MGDIGILSVGAGDTKLSFDRNDPAEMIRVARIVTDMLQRGYALLVENPPGSGKYQRAYAFDADACEYIIADFDPLQASCLRNMSGGDHEPGDRGSAAAVPTSAAPENTAASPATPSKRGKPVNTKRVHAADSKAVAVPRIAGG